MAGSLRASRKRRARRGAVGLLAVAGIAAVVGAGGLSESADAAPVGTITEYPVPAGPNDITAGPDGNLWFTSLQNRVQRITRQGAITDFPLRPNPDTQGGDADAVGITAGPDDNLWFTKNLTREQDRIGRITPNGAVTEFPIPRPLADAKDIAAGPDGNVWFTEPFTNRIGRITPTGAVARFLLPNTPSNPFDCLDTGLVNRCPYPFRIVAGPDGNLWFTERFAQRIGRITPGGAITEFPIPGGKQDSSFGLGAPVGITAGPDNNLWFTRLGQVLPVDRGSPVPSGSIARITSGCPPPPAPTVCSGAAGAVTEYPIPPPNSNNPTDIAAGPDGNLWYVTASQAFDNGGPAFGERPGNNKVGRITPVGVITEFEIPTQFSQPQAITSGPAGDEHMWFTERQGKKIGRITAIDSSAAGVASAPAPLPGAPPANAVGRSSPGEVPVDTAREGQRLRPAARRAETRRRYRRRQSRLQRQQRRRNERPSNRARRPPEIR